MKLFHNIIFLVFIMFSPLCLHADHYQETLLGVVGAGNYSYYMLTNPGTVILYLSTIEGDADLYVSSKNLKPTYDVENHELQSTTCGTEQIKVSARYDRPLSIAVYGHPSHDISFYELKIDVFDPPEDTDLHPDLDVPKKPHSTSKPTSPPNLTDKDDKPYEEQSMFWSLFLRILQVLLDLLVD